MSLSTSDIARFGEDAQRQILAKLALDQVKRQKYGNRLVERNGIRFQSQKEARRYDELMILLKAGQISDLRLQADFTLQEGYTTADGQRIRAIRYKADFTYCDAGGKFVVEDVKGVRTDVYKLKRKMMLDRLGIEIREV